MTALLQEWVTEQAGRRPDATAIVLKDQRLAYAALEDWSTKLGRALKAAGCRRGDRVCLLMPKTPAAMVGILGALKADCIYVPLDPSSPAPRLAQMIAACEPRCLLATAATAPLLDQLWADGKFPASISVGWMERERLTGEHFAPAFSLAECQHYPATPLEYANAAGDAAYILFTSGSTGTPKGVVITHASVMHFVRWAVRYFGLTPSDRISGHPPLHFDLSVFDIFGTFAAGAQLHLVPAELSLLPNKLAEFIRASELTQWFSVPSVLNYLAKFDAVPLNGFPALKRVLWCGEVLPTPVLIYWMRRLPGVQFTNLYGPTEATIASSYYTVPRCPDDPTAAIPIGTACAGEELLVLDKALRPAPRGEVGEIYIRGVGLSPGYWRDPERTRAAFLPDPLSADPAARIYRTGDLGNIGDDRLVYFLGRADSQVKSRGYRIELGEIETWLHAMACLKESAVVAIPTDGFEGAAICCAYAPAPGDDPTPVSLRNELAKVLPAYMLPARWLAFEALPKNASGKIDRRRLKEEFARHAAQAP